jgi:hypothetical protein
MLSSPFSLKENGTARTLPLHINRRNALAYRNCPAAGATAATPANPLAVVGNHPAFLPFLKKIKPRFSAGLFRGGGRMAQRMSRGIVRRITVLQLKARLKAFRERERYE